MRKIAIPLNGEKLHAHFGGAGVFKFYIVEDNKIVNTENAIPPPHEPGVIPKWVAEMGATDIILGGIGQRAVTIFEQFNIKVVKGAGEENADQLVEQYLSGTLEASGENCTNRDHHGEEGHRSYHS